MQTDFWKKQTIENAMLYRWQFGSAVIIISRLGKTLTIHKQEIVEENIPNGHDSQTISSVPDEGTHFITDKKQLFVLPALPNQPMVMKPLTDIRIAPGMQSTIFFEVPISVQFYLGNSKPESLLMEIPLLELSQTWFGEPDNGTLGYAGNGRVLFTFQPETIQPNHALCPVKLHNFSRQVLDFQRFLLNVEQLSIYTEENYMCTNETRVTYRGEDSVSDIQIVKSKPGFSDKLKLMSPARDADTTNVFQKSFHFLKSITQ